MAGITIYYNDTAGGYLKKALSQINDFSKKENITIKKH